MGGAKGVRVARAVGPWLTALRLLGAFPFYPDSSFSPLSLSLGALLAIASCRDVVSRLSESGSLKDLFESNNEFGFGLVLLWFLAASLRGRRDLFKAVSEIVRAERELRRDAGEVESRCSGSPGSYLDKLLLIQFLVSLVRVMAVKPRVALFSLPQGLALVSGVALVAAFQTLVKDLLRESSRRFSLSPFPSHLLPLTVALWRASRLLDSFFRGFLLLFTFLVFSSSFLNLYRLLRRETTEFFGDSEPVAVRALRLWPALSTGPLLFHRLVSSSSGLRHQGERLLEVLYAAAAAPPGYGPPLPSSARAKVRLVLRARPSFRFSVCHLFALDDTLVPPLYATVAMYVVVMLQLR